MPMPRRCGAIRTSGELTTRPLSSTRPRVGSMSPERSLRRVVFPLPDGPVTAICSPSSIAKATRARAGRAPKSFSRSSQARAGPMAITLPGRARGAPSSAALQDDVRKNCILPLEVRLAFDLRRDHVPREDVGEVVDLDRDAVAANDAVDGPIVERAQRIELEVELGVHAEVFPAHEALLLLLSADVEPHVVRMGRGPDVEPDLAGV